MGPISEVLFILVLILLNGLLAMAEIAIVSARKVRLFQPAEEGNERARVALDLANDPTSFLSTVQIGITLIGILAGAFGGATISKELAAWLKTFPLLAAYSNILSILFVVIPITFFSLILGELAPKRVALNNPERVAMALAPPMRLLSRVFAPLVSALSASTNFLLRILGVQSVNMPLVTEDEIRVVIEQGGQAGILEEAEQDMLAGVLRLGDRRVGTLMTPRTEIVWLDLEDPSEENLRRLIESEHSRLPVAKGDLDHIRGDVVVKDLLAQVIQGKPLDLISNLEPPRFIPEGMPALKVMEVFKESGRHLLMVIDEFGGLQGLVTLNDLLGSIVGDVSAPWDNIEPEVMRREDGTYLVDGMLPVDEFIEFLRLRNLPNLDKGIYQTLGGFIMDYLGQVPKTGDHFEWGGYRFEVMDMDGMRVDKVLISPISERQ